MTQIIKTAGRHSRDMGWLRTCGLFSFSSYYNPENLSHGSIRVFNDDIKATKNTDFLLIETPS